MLAEKLAVSAGVDKDTAEAFLKAFPDVLLASVAQDRLVELDKFGKFFLVAVADRGSVDVNTGAHIVIPGYDKLTFSVDDSIVGQFNDAQPKDGADEKASEDEKVKGKAKEKPAKPTVAPAAKKPKVAAPVVEAEAEQVKPKSIKQEPVKSEPKVVEVKAVEQAPEPKPIAVTNPTPEPTLSPVAVAEQKQAETHTEPKAEPVHVQEKVVAVPEPEPSKMTVAEFFKNLPWWGYVTLVAAVFLIVLFAVLNINGGSSDEATDEQVAPAYTEQAAKEAKTEPKAEKHKVHILKYGESLTTISVQYYGTPDSMGAIWRLNKFENPNAIPLGTAIKLP